MYTKIFMSSSTLSIFIYGTLVGSWIDVKIGLDSVGNIHFTYHNEVEIVVASIMQGIEVVSDGFLCFSIPKLSISLSWLRKIDDNKKLTKNSFQITLDNKKH